MPDCFIATDDIADKHLEVFPTNIVMHTQKCRVGNDMTLNNSFMLPVFAEESSLPKLQCSMVVKNNKKLDNVVSDSKLITVPITNIQMVVSQQEDFSLVKCFSAAEHPKPIKDNKAEYVIDELLR